MKKLIAILFFLIGFMGVQNAQHPSVKKFFEEYIDKADWTYIYNAPRKSKEAKSNNKQSYSCLLTYEGRIKNNPTVDNCLKQFRELLKTEGFTLVTKVKDASDIIEQYEFGGAGTFNDDITIMTSSGELVIIWNYY